MGKPRVKKLAQFRTRDGGWFNKADLSEEEQRWVEETGWCAVFALLVNVHLNFPNQHIPPIASDEDLRRLREHWEQSVTCPIVFATWPALNEKEVIFVLDQVYGLTCRRMCENFTLLNSDDHPKGVPIAKLEEVRGTQTLKKLASYTEFWKANAVGFIVACDGDDTERHALAFTTRESKCSVVFIDAAGHSRITKHWFRDQGDLIVLQVYQVCKCLR